MAAKGAVLIESQAREPAEDLRTRLKDEGYLFLRGAVDESLCKCTAEGLMTELGSRILDGSLFQEEPKETFSKDLQTLMEACQAEVLKKCKKLGLGDCFVPELWNDTLYGRVKKNNSFTPYHTDALNMVFERKFLKIMQERDESKALITSPAGKEFFETGKFDSSKFHPFHIPIFTYWVCLTQIHERKQSHLRLYPRSHSLPGFCAKSSKRQRNIPAQYLVQNLETVSEYNKVEPIDYKYNAKDFVGPEFPKGYQIGDIVIFHCLLMHEGSDQTMKGFDRISMDGRFFLNMDLSSSSSPVNLNNTLMASTTTKATTTTTTSSSRVAGPTQTNEEKLITKSEEAKAEQEEAVEISNARTATATKTKKQKSR